MTAKKGKGKKDPVTGVDLMVDGYRRVFHGLQGAVRGFRKGFSQKKKSRSSDTDDCILHEKEAS